VPVGASHETAPLGSLASAERYAMPGSHVDPGANVDPGAEDPAP
jgi:hypothetical protein